MCDPALFRIAYLHNTFTVSAVYIVYGKCTVCGFSLSYDLLPLPHVYFVKYCIPQCSALNLTFHSDVKNKTKPISFLTHHLIGLAKV